MAVYERSYRLYEGERQATWQRLLVLPRYAYKQVFQSKWMTMFFAACFVLPLGAAGTIYLHHNIGALVDLGIDIDQLLAIDAEFFSWIVRAQTLFFASVMTIFVGPGLISRDLANNGLALYFSRPLSRSEYVLGKLLVLAILLSAITWVPCLLLFGVQANLEGWSWFAANLRIAAGIFLGAWIWILPISLLALAISAWVKWRALAGLGVVVVLLFGGVLGQMINAFFRTDWGNVFKLVHASQVIFAQLLGTKPPSTLPAWAAWVALAAMVAVSLGLLNAKLRAYEVVK